MRRGMNPVEMTINYPRKGYWPSQESNQRDELADVSIVGLQWFILIPQLNHTGSHRPSDSHSKSYLHRGKNIYRIWNKNHPTCSNPMNYEESSHSSLILVAFYDMPQRKAEVLFYTVKTPRDPTGVLLTQPWGSAILFTVDK